MLDLAQKLEAAVKAIIDAEATGATCYAGLSDDEKTTPRITVVALNGPETPQGSGNFNLSLSVEVRSNATDKELSEHRTLCATVLGVMCEDDIATQLSGAETAFYAFGISNRNAQESVDAGAWVTTLTMDVYCAGIALV